MSTSKRVAAGATWLLSTQIATAVVQLGYAAFTSRHADHAAFGQYAIALSATALLSLIANSGLGVAASRMADTRAALTRPLVGLSLLTGVVTAGLLSLFSSPWARLWGDPEASWAIRFLGLGLVLSPAVGVQSGLLRREGKFKTLATILIITSIVAMVVGMAAVSSHPGAVSLSVMTVCSTFLQFGALSMALGVKGLPSFAISHAREELNFGSKALLGSLILYTGMTAPVVAMTRVMSVTTLGEWNRATVLGYVPMQMVTASAQQALYPEFRTAAEDKARTRDVWSRLLGLSVILVWPIAAAALPWFPAATSILLGPGWETSGTMAQWLLASTALYFPLAIIWSAQESAGMFKEIWTGFGLYAGLLVLTAGFVVATRQWTSAALGLVLAAALTLVVCSLRLLRFGFLDRSLAGRDCQLAVGAAGVLGVGSIALSQLSARLWLGALLSGLLTGLVYAYLFRQPALANLRSALGNRAEN